MVTSIIFVWCCGKASMYTSKWIVGKDSMKRYCRTRKSFTAAGQWKISGMLATNMRKESEISKYKTSENITSISTEWCITFDWYIRKFPQQTHRNILAWCCTTFDVTALPWRAWQLLTAQHYHGGHENFRRHSISMAGMSEKDRSRTGATNGCWYTTHGRKKHQWHAIHRCVKVNQHMKDYDQSKESLYLMYWNVNNFYGWTMLQKLTVDDFEWRKDLLTFNEKFIKNYDEDSDNRWQWQPVVDVKYPKETHNLHSDLPFLSKRMKIDKCEKLECNLCNKKNNVTHTRALKQTLHHGLILEKLHRVIEFNQEAWLKPYADMNTELWTKLKMLLKRTSLS